MNRNQWFVLGIGLILSSFFFSFLSGEQDCLALQRDAIATRGELKESGADAEYVVASSMDAWVNYCLDTNMSLSTLSSTWFTLGIIFVILGFLEAKKKKA